MRLQDCLKIKKVRCFIGDATVTTGRVYDVVGLDKAFIHVIDDNDEVAHYWYSRFEPVLDDTEIDTSADNVDLHSEFEALAPHVSSPSNNDAPHVSERPSFKAGQKAYCPWLNEGKLVLLEANHITDLFAETAKGRQYFNEDGTSIEVRRPAQPDLFHATQENYELLSKLMPWVDYEAPPQPLTGSDLCRRLIDKGELVMAKVNIKSKYGADIVVITRYHEDKFYSGTGASYCDVSPINSQGEPLTEAVLDE